MTFEKRAKEITDDFSFWGPPITPMQTLRLECNDRIIALLRQVQAEAYEDAAELMEKKFHKVSRQPVWSNSCEPTDMYSPFAEEIRAHAKVVGK